MTAKTETIEETGLLWKPIGRRDEFKDNANNRYEFIDFIPKTNIVRAWQFKNLDERNGVMIVDKTDLTRRNLSVTYLPVCELKTLGIFDLLPEEIKKNLEALVVQDESEVKDKMEHARKHRKFNPEYAHLPRMISCTNCHTEQYIAPSQLIKKAQLKNVSSEEFHKTFVCSKCNPIHRGRKPSAKYINMVKELHCHHGGCTVIKKQHPSITEKAALSAGIKYQEYVDTWFCKEHKPVRVHQFSKEGRLARGIRGRKPNPEYADIPKEIACKGCGKIVKLVPQNIIGKAKLLKITVKDLLDNYRCRSCGGRITKAKVKEAGKGKRSKK